MHSESGIQICWIIASRNVGAPFPAPNALVHFCTFLPCLLPQTPFHSLAFSMFSIARPKALLQPTALGLDYVAQHSTWEYYISVPSSLLGTSLRSTSYSRVPLQDQWEWPSLRLFLETPPSSLAWLTLGEHFLNKLFAHRSSL